MINRSNPGNKDIDGIFANKLPYLDTMMKLEFNGFEIKPDPNPHRKLLVPPIGLDGQKREAPAQFEYIQPPAAALSINSFCISGPLPVVEQVMIDPRERLLLDLKEKLGISTTFENYSLGFSDLHYTEDPTDPEFVIMRDIRDSRTEYIAEFHGLFCVLMMHDGNKARKYPACIHLFRNGPIKAGSSRRGGTHGYMAPEVLREEVIDDQDAHKCDIYGAGWVVLDMINRSAPGSQAVDRIFEDKLPYLNTVRELVVGCTQEQLSERFRVEAALKLCKTMTKEFAGFDIKPDPNPHQKRLVLPIGLDGQKNRALMHDYYEGFNRTKGIRPSFIEEDGIEQFEKMRELIDDFWSQLR
ncbi:unnamed protein product, partial [Mesorhabditis spiculigera]